MEIGYGHSCPSKDALDEEIQAGDDGLQAPSHQTKYSFWGQKQHL